MKVICAGAPKTGTKSLAKALRILGYDAVYDVEEAVEFAFKEWEDIWERKQPDMKALMDTVYSNVEAVVDVPHSCYFDQFLQHWPDAKVILTTRDEEKWFQSYKAMCERGTKSYGYLYWLQFFSPSLYRMLKWQIMLFTVTVGVLVPHEFIWKSWYRRHNNFVRSIVAKSQLMEYNVADGWEPLCEFLNKPIPSQEFPFENKAGGGNHVEDRMMQETWIAKKVKQELTIFFTVMPLLLVMIVSCCFFY